MPVKVTPPDVEGFYNQKQATPPSKDELNGHRPSFDPPSPSDAGDQVAIDVGCDHLPTLRSLCWEAIKRENKPPILFRYGNAIVRIAHTDAGGIWLQLVTPEIMRHHLSNWGHWHKHQIKLAKPPLDVVNDVLATPDVPLPTLRRVVSVPVFAPDGSLRLEAGYNPASGVLYEPAAGFKALPLPAEITGKDVDEANQLLCGEVLVDFPFAATADRDNAIALFLLPFVRDLIDGPTPCHLIEASMPSSGKTLLGELLMYPSVGEDMGLITPPGREEEWVKQITTVLLNAKPVVLIDNVTVMLNSGSLAAAWTARIWDQRVLGGHESANVPIRCVWIMTANNPALSTELVTRQVRIRITPQTDHPEERTEFKHAELSAWVAEHRAELVLAAHVMIRWWLQQGSPAPKAKLLSRYPTWSRVIGGILEACGYKDFLGNYREFVSAADLQRMARSNFCSTWFDWAQRDLVNRQRATAADLTPLAEGVEGFPLIGETSRAQTTSLGKWLRKNLDAVVQHVEDDSAGIPVKRVFRIGKWPMLIEGRTYWTIEKLE